MSARVCVVGALHRDLRVRAERFPRPGETLLGRDFAAHVGGKGANQAVAASRLGARVALVGAVGDDEWGHAIRAALTVEGIDLAHLARETSAPTGIGLITVVPGGENTIVVAPGADHSVTPEAVERASGAIAEAEVLLVQGELAAETTRRAVAIARKSNTRVIYNASPAVPLPEGFLREVDVLVVNREEAAELLGDERREIGPPGLVRRLSALGPERVLVTLGPEGAFHFDGGELALIEAFAVESVDTTGAGDAFTAALAVARAEGARMEDATRFACAAGALSTTREGTLPAMATREEVEDLVRSRGKRVRAL